MRQFEEPIVQVQKFDVEDVITTSNPYEDLLDPVPLPQG